MFIVSTTAEAEAPTFEQIAREHQMVMVPKNTNFSGPGWEHIVERVKSARHTLVGEDHFTNEIPVLIDAIGAIGDFENFYIEVDPYSTELLERNFQTLSALERAEFNRQYQDFFSFYALEPEYHLLENMVNRGTHLLGSDQIVMYADSLVLKKWLTKTQNTAARKIYEEIISASDNQFRIFLNDPSQPMYFMTPAFSEQLAQLSSLPLSEEEQALIHYLKLSVDIYQTQSHRKRVKLIKHHLMNDYDRWISKRTLFKFGANHLTRGESFLTVHDIGVLVANLSEAKFQESYHIMVMGETGFQGAPFRGFPASALDPDGFYLKHLAPFFELTDDNKWQVFDLLPLRRAIVRKKINIDNVNLRRTIMGYDTLVLIPEVTAAAFPSRE